MECLIRLCHSLPKRAKLTKAAGVLFSLFVTLACISNYSRDVSSSGTEAIDTLRVEKGNIFVIDSLSQNKLGRVTLGSLYEGETLESSFKLENGFKEPLIINSLRATCGCLVSEIDVKPILPQAQRQVDFTYNSKGKRGRQITAFIIETSSGKYRIELDVTVKSSN